MNIAKNSIRKNYYFIPKSFVRTFTIFSSVGVFYHFAKNCNFFERFYKKVKEIEQEFNYEEIKNSCLNFVGEMLFDNLAKINFSNYFNEVVNNPGNSENREKEIERKDRLVKDLLIRILNDKNQMEKIRTKFILSLLESDSFKEMNSSEFNRKESQEEITNFLKELFTSDEIVEKFRKLLEKDSRNDFYTKQFNKKIYSLTEKILQDDELKNYLHTKLEEKISTLKYEKVDEMKKVNKELIELINKL